MGVEPFASHCTSGVRYRDGVVVGVAGAVERVGSGGASSSFDGSLLSGVVKDDVRCRSISGHHMVVVVVVPVRGDFAFTSPAGAPSWDPLPLLVGTTIEEEEEDV